MPHTDINGLRINYIDSGNGVPIVFIPDLAGSKEWFIYQTSGLSDRYRVISYDLRLAHDRVSYTLELLSNDLARFLSSLRLYSAIVVGHSFGGLIALQFALSHPEYCLALGLISTTPKYPDLPGDELLSHLFPGEIKLQSFWGRFWAKLFRAHVEREEEIGSMGYLTKHTAGLDRATLSARLKLLRETDMTPHLERIPVPTLIVAGSLDRAYILNGSQTLEQRIDDSTLEVIENADEFCFYKRHDLFNAILVDYYSHKVPRP